MEEQEPAHPAGERLLAGVRVVDLAGEPGQMASRLLADLGAVVVKVEPPGGDPFRSQDQRFVAWNAGKRSVVLGGDEGGDGEVLRAWLAGADVVFDTPGWPGAVEADPGMAPNAVWVSITPFGRTGPRSHWRASDLGVMAASGNMYATGDADRAPVRCTEPSGYAHTGPEAAFAALTGLASARPQRVDLSMQEVVLIASMGAVGRYFRAPSRGRRSGAAMGRTREIWACADGFVSFGLRGGAARVANLQTMARLLQEAGLASPAWSDRDWESYNPGDLSDEELRAIEEPIARYFAGRTMAELYQTACETNLMLAPANSPKELYGSAQLAARDFFGPLGGVERFPLSFVKARSADGLAATVRPERGSPVFGDAGPPWPEGRPPAIGSAGEPAWQGTRILEFGSGAAGPIATRYFAEHGATVIKVESRLRPDFLRTYLLAGSPHGLEGADMFDALNAGKLGITLNLKHPRAVDLARRLATEWADAVSENFAPKAMRGFGLHYDALAELRPDLVMISACLQGNTGPHRNYPGFGGQGSALAGFNFLTGWPDRYPLGPHGTITDSLAPRFVAAALAAGLLYRRRTGRGVYLDLSQVEAAVWSLSPWLLDYEVGGRLRARAGNRSDRACPHGAFPCAGEDRWVAIAVWSDDEWERLVKLARLEDPALARLATREERLAHVDELEAALGAWTAGHDAIGVAASLQAAGIEAVPVADFADAFADPQLAHRSHLLTLTHPFMGEGRYERNGFRLSDAPSGYSRPSPTLGQDNASVLGEILGLSPADRDRLASEGALD